MVMVMVMVRARAIMGIRVDLYLERTNLNPNHATFESAV